jgi:hypothetical protein
MNEEPPRTNGKRKILLVMPTQPVALPCLSEWLTVPKHVWSSLPRKKAFTVKIQEDALSANLQSWEPIKGTH